jgi:hypothetical protein
MGFFFTYYVCEMKKTPGIKDTRQNFVISRENNESAAIIAAWRSVKRKENTKQN